METYSPEEVKQIIAMLHSIKEKKNKSGTPTKLDKQIRYLEQRLKFFNPTKEMLGYIISLDEKAKQKLDPALMQKLKDERAKKHDC